MDSMFNSSGNGNLTLGADVSESLFGTRATPLLLGTSLEPSYINFCEFIWTNQDAQYNYVFYV